MAAGVDVIAPVSVAALVNGNDTVAVIDAVNEHATCDAAADIAGMLHFQKLDMFTTRAIELPPRHREMSAD